MKLFRFVGRKVDTLPAPPALACQYLRVARAWHSHINAHPSFFVESICFFDRSIFCFRDWFFEVTVDLQHGSVCQPEAVMGFLPASDHPNTQSCCLRVADRKETIRVRVKPVKQECAPHPSPSLSRHVLLLLSVSDFVSCHHLVRPSPSFYTAKRTRHCYPKLPAHVQDFSSASADRSLLVPVRGETRRATPRWMRRSALGRGAQPRTSRSRKRQRERRTLPAAYPH